MSSSSSQPESKRRLSKLRNFLIVALVVAYPFVAWRVFAYGGLVGEAALWAGALPQVFCYLGLLWLFGRSLRGGREALITRMARYVHDDALPPEIERYTRQLTVFWCFYFAGMSVASVYILFFVSVDAWLFFANVLNLPVLASVFVVEYGYRLLRFPDYAHQSLTAPIRAYRRFRRSFGED